MGSDWPTFILSWKHGINDFRGNGTPVNHYDLFRVEAHQHKEIGAFSQFRWRAVAGSFLDNSRLTFYDFNHFNEQPLPVLINDYHDAFMLPSYYSLSSPEAFFEVHAKYTTPYLLLKLLPGLSNTLIRENLQLSYLGRKGNPSYTEIGYSLSEIFLFAEAGIFVGLDNLQYRSFGARIILKFN